MMLYQKTLAVGPAQNLCYLIGDPLTKEAVVIDPAWDIAAILKELEKDDMKLKGILVSHFHPDHVGGHYWGQNIPGVSELIKTQDVPIYLQREEWPYFNKMTGVPESQIRYVNKDDTIAVGNIQIRCMHTPGHTPGSQCFLCQNQLFSGDTLFLRGCGRVDLPGGSKEQLFESLNKVGELPEETFVNPGHSYDAEKIAKLSFVKQVNPYLKMALKHDWNQFDDNR